MQPSSNAVYTKHISGVASASQEHFITQNFHRLDDPQ